MAIRLVHGSCSAASTVNPSPYQVPFLVQPAPFVEFAAKYSIPEAGLKRIEAVLCAVRKFCPYWDRSEKIYHFQDGRHRKCNTCGRVFRIITGTNFPDSPVQIWPKWFLAIYLDTCPRRGRSCNWPEHRNPVTAGRPRLQRIRHAARTGAKASDIVPLPRTTVGSPTG